MDEYELKIKDLSPSTTPMARLAAYMEELAKLMGEKDSVTFSRVESGSLRLIANVEDDASNNVRVRLKNPAARRDTHAAYLRLEAMLTEDKTKAEILHAGSNVITLYPKVKEPEHNSPMEMISIRGKLIAIGGKDDSVPFTLLEQSTGDTIRGNTSVDIAIELGSLLFSMIEVSGAGHWSKNQSTGLWDLQKFKVSSYRPLKQIPVSETVATLRELSNEAASNPLDILKELRD